MEAVWAPAVFLHEYSHAAVYELFDVDYEVRLSWLTPGISWSHVRGFDEVPRRAAILSAIAPYSLLIPAVLVTIVLGATWPTDSTILAVLSAVLFVQGIGLVGYAMPSKADISAVFVNRRTFDGRWWSVVLVGSWVVQVVLIVLWLQLTRSVAAGSGVSVPSVGAIGTLGALTAVVGFGFGVRPFDRTFVRAVETDLRVQHAGACFERGDDAAAVRHVRRAIADVEAHDLPAGDPYAVYAAILCEKGRFSAAARYCARALEVDPSCESAHVNRAAALLEMERYEDAEVHCRRALELTADDAFGTFSAAAHANYASVLVHRERFDEACEHCRRALELEPTMPAMHVVAGELCAARGAFADANRRYLRAIELGPDRGSTRYEYARFLEAHADDATAERQFRWALDLEPNFVPALEAYASFLDADGRPDEAADYAGRAATVDEFLDDWDTDRLDVVLAAP